MVAAIDKNQSDKKDKLIPFFKDYFSLITIFVFITLSIILIIRHEFWFDEVRSWHIASESHSLSEMFGITRFAEGTPSLWYLILYFVSHFITDNIEAMKAIHLIFSTMTAFLILRYSPFNKVIKLMLIFGYFFFYEYSIISRNYAIGVFFIILFCVLYKNKYSNILPLGIVLFFMGQTNAQAFFISICLFIILVIDMIVYSKKQKINKAYLTLFVLIFLFEVIVFLWQMIPQAEASSILNLSLSNKLEKLSNLFSLFASINQFSQNIIKVFIPIPENSINFWDSSLLVDFFNPAKLIYLFIISFLLMMVPLFVIKKRIIPVYYFGLILLSLGPLIYKNPIRILGFIFILFIVFLWISNSEENSIFILKNKNNRIKILQNIILYLLLSVSIFSSSIAFYYDFNFPFSHSKNVADYIEENYDKDNLTIIGFPNVPTETVAGYLNKDLYYPQEEKFGKLVEWDNRGDFTADKFIKNINIVKSGSVDKDILIITDYRGFSNLISEELAYFYQFELIKNFSSPTILPSESYKIYALDRDIKFNLIKKINLSEFDKNWKNINNCEFEIKDNNNVLIKPLNDDPNFESDFKMPVLDNEDLFIKIEIVVPFTSELTIYYKKPDSQYNENQKIVKEMSRGINILFIKIDNINEIQAIRIDPINAKAEHIIKSIEFYEYVN